MAPSQSGGVIPEGVGPLAQIKVLIVEGEHHARRTLRSLLVALGCNRIHEARDGESGLEAIRALAPDIVLLDWELPGMGGASFVRQLRGTGFPGASAAIIMLVGREQRSQVLEAVRLGVHEFLLKPISTGALKARLSSVLDRSHKSSRRARQPSSNLRKLAS